MEEYSKCRIFFELPNASHPGLWFPYLSDLALADKGVPDIIKRRFKDTLGDTAENIHQAFESFCSAWGTLKHTEFGKVLSHLLQVIDIAIECQASVKLRGQKDVYEGAVLVGARFTVTVQGRLFEPGSAEKLNDAINMFGNNSLLLKKIAKELGYANLDAFETIGSFSELRRAVQSSDLQDVDAEGVLVLIRQLSFPKHPYWKPSLENIVSMLKYVDPNKFPMEELLGLKTELLPMGPDAVFAGDRERIVLSCFGPEVPSFVIPYGGKMSLEGDFGKNVVQPRKRGEGSGQKTFQVCNEVSIRLVPMKVALSDLSKVKDEKAIYNPFAVPKAKRSAGNQYKTFTGEGAKKLVGQLKEFVGVLGTTASGSKKRHAEDAGGEGSNKRQAISWDF